MRSDPASPTVFDLGPPLTVRQGSIAVAVSGVAIAVGCAVMLTVFAPSAVVAIVLATGAILVAGLSVVCAVGLRRGRRAGWIGALVIEASAVGGALVGGLILPTLLMTACVLFLFSPSAIRYVWKR